MANRLKNRRFDLLHDDRLAQAEKRSSKPKPKRDSANLLPGVVLRARGHHYDVRTHEGDDFRLRLCEVRGRLLAEKRFDTLVTVGDRVWVLPSLEDHGLIERIDERRSSLSRQQPGAKISAEDVILANLDQVLIVFAAAEPEPHLRMLDRFLVIAEANQLNAVICVNKIDLVGIDNARALFAEYERIGYEVLYVCAQSGFGIEDLRNLLLDKVTAVVGPSGVGKSSLLNAIHPELQLRTGELRQFLHKGRHTTRSAQLFALPLSEESYVADTPGIRELGLYEIDPANLPFYFIEMKPCLSACRYPSCTHDHEPECAVREAVAAGKISTERYDSYLRLLYGEE
jgi:ribosome biogenesis GTPase